MIRGIWITAVLLSMIGTAFAAPKGTVPKSNPLSYPAHGEHDGVAIGAKVLTSAEVRKTFTTDVKRCCVVVEVAMYPRKDKPSEVSLDDFVLQVKNTDTAAKPSSPKVIARKLQKKAQDQRDVTVAPSVGVGYGSNAYDPVYGPQRGGVYTTAGVGVGVGGRGNQPGSSEKDRAAMETELGEKGLPEGTAGAPIAGYLYFSLPREKKAIYELQYLIDGKKTLLELKLDGD